ncbi:dipeptide/oligopeptide/nickel ABC transporter ATP-binding protein [Paenibacillus sp. FSL H8-0332]|uniref:ABC transporter ATP-binding protein n=1 Tax=Paenibacillus sp. FSL H8-0332 TaxID=2954742 RepID=UPI0030CE846C
MITIRNLHKQYTVKDKSRKRIVVDAVNHISLTLQDDTGYALIGESGSGKSTLAKMLAGIETATSGEIWLDEINLATLKGEALRRKRSEFQLVLQNSQSALDPRRTIYHSIAEPLRCLSPQDTPRELERIQKLAYKVGLPEALLTRLPHELSGGQQKRACIARAISISPKFIIFDESVSGLDVTVRKQILDLIVRLKEEEKSTFLFITHDIDVALYLSSNILVMKEGSIVEQLNNAASYDDFQHEYSKMLIAALPLQSHHIQ